MWASMTLWPIFSCKITNTTLKSVSSEYPNTKKWVEKTRRNKPKSKNEDSTLTSDKDATSFAWENWRVRYSTSMTEKTWESMAERNFDIQEVVRRDVAIQFHYPSLSIDRILHFCMQTYIGRCVDRYAADMRPIRDRYATDRRLIVNR